jgi:hypothetical protein
MKRLFGNYLLARIGLAAAVFSGMLWISGCGGNNNPVKPDDGGGKSLTLPSGQAWVDTSGNGIIFAADGRFFKISKETSSWWMDGEGTYTVDDIEIKLAFSSDTGTLLFKLSKEGDTLTLYRAGGIRPPNAYSDGGVYTKTPGVKFVIPPPNPGTGGNLVLPSGQAWINAATGIGFIFGSDSIVSMIGGANGTWVLTSEGIYSAKDGHIVWTIETYWGDGDTVSYTVSGNSLAMTLDYHQTIAFTKTSNVNISANTGGSLVLPSGQAWVRETGYSWDGVLGFIFESDGTVSLISGNDGVWDLANTGTYTARGNKINIAMKEAMEEITGMFTVSGNSFILTLDNGITLVFTKRSGISIAPHVGGNLVLPSGQAWTYKEGSTENGYIFQANGQVLEISRYQGGSWSIDERGTYTTSDANITVIWNYGCYNDDDEWVERCETYTQIGVYSVTGKSLVLVLNGHRMNLTITSGVTVRSSAPDLLKKPVAPAPKSLAGREILTFRRH